MAVSNKGNNAHNLRVIQTARDVESINKAIKLGFTPLLRKVEVSADIRTKYAVVRHKKSGKIKVIGDFRMGFEIEKNNDHEYLIDWSYYYPYSFRSPFAAYLLPKDIEPGERVFLEDLIEDLVGTKWNQGDTYRLESCEAIWTGSDLEIQYNPNRTSSRMVG
jgi:hypothetical protein